MMDGDQTSVFLTAIAQGAQVARFPLGITTIGTLKGPFLIVHSDADERIRELIARL